MAEKPSYEELEQRITELENGSLGRKKAEKQSQLEYSRLMGILDSIPDGVYIVDQHFNIEYINPVIEKDFGKIQGRKCYQYFHDRAESCLWCKNDEVFAGRSVNWEWYSVKNDRHYELFDTPFQNPDGSISKFEIFHDITDRKQAEQQKELKTRILDTMNRAVNWKEGIEDILNDIKEFSGFEAVAIRLREGEDFPYYVTQGFPAHFVEAEKYLCSRDSKGEITRDSEGNPYVECMCGNVICGRTDQEKDFFTKGGSFWSNNTSKLLSETTDEDRQTRTRNRCNSEGYESVALIPLKTGNEILGLIQLNDTRTHRFTDNTILLFEDIGISIGTAFSRKMAKEALLKSEERFRTVADFTHDWEYWITPEGSHTYVSPSCERITGYSPDEFLNDPGLLEKIVHPDDQSTFVTHLRKTAQREGAFDLDFRIITRDGKERWINHVCQPVYGSDAGYLGQRASNRDISKQKLMQEELLKAKKLEPVGALAGGIAHDFNNLMSVVVGNISLARTEMRPGSKGFKNLVEAEKASIQTTALTSRLITFSKGGRPVKEQVSIGDLVKNSVGSSLKGSDISCIFSVPEDFLPVEVDEEQMKQVIHNITTNAQEAMAEQGTINVSCENVNIGEKDTLNLKDGKYVKISIEDQGPGIPEEELMNIFDPYFSTKDMGTQKGMGLGLAVSDSIVKKHDGLITVESKLGTGTTFSIYLPASEKKIVGATHVKKPILEISATQGEKILVMDDEEVVRDVSNALLTHLGYEVAVAVDGVEAIELYKKAMGSEKPFDMVILDLTNKIGMGGAETMVNLLGIDPDVKAIVASGYSNDPLMSNFREHGFRGALPKPFNLDQLKTALQDAIAGK